MSNLIIIRQERDVTIKRINKWFPSKQKWKIFINLKIFTFQLIGKKSHKTFQKKSILEENFNLSTSVVSSKNLLRSRSASISNFLLDFNFYCEALKDSTGSKQKFDCRYRRDAKVFHVNFAKLHNIQRQFCVGAVEHNDFVYLVQTSESVDSSILVHASSLKTHKCSERQQTCLLEFLLLSCNKATSLFNSFVQDSNMHFASRIFSYRNFCQRRSESFIPTFCCACFSFYSFFCFHLENVCFYFIEKRQR